MWGPFLQTLLGGLLTLAGGALGPWILQRQKDREENKKRRAEKFEALVRALYEFDRWLDDNERKHVHGEEDTQVGVSPFAKVEAIAAVYFPQVLDKAEAVRRAARDFERWMPSATIKRIQEAPAEQILDGLSEAYAPYAKERDDLLADLKKIAAKGF